MINFTEIIKKQKFKKIFNTKMYNFRELKNNFKKLKCQYLLVTDLVFVPFYIDNGKRMELYDFEFNIRIVKEKNIEKFILSKTGKNTINEIANDIVEKYHICYIETTDGKIDKKVIFNYLNYMFSNINLINEITNIFGSFKEENLFFEIY